ncbi:MAG: quinolinate synthase NadA [Methanobacteriota archaeon]
MASEIQRRIAELKARKGAIILAHNYQLPEVQDAADFVGDSFGLSVTASKTDAKLIVFCGVDFMAESALILNPSKRVVVPDHGARCPMAAMITPEALRKLKAENPGVPVVAYVNTSAAVKAETDVCCTSSNAVKVVKSLDSEKVIFVPDRNLGLYVQRFVEDKELILWPGYCPTHEGITVGKLKEARAAHPDAEIIVHPECTPEAIDFADAAASTEGMVNRVKASQKREFILGTEVEHAYRMGRLFPDKTFHSIPGIVCPNMKKTTLDKVAKSLETLETAISVPEDIIRRARRPLDRMVEIGRGD